MSRSPVALLLPTLFLASCGTSKFLVIKAPEQPFGPFGTVVVDPFAVESQETMDAAAKAIAVDAASQMTTLLVAGFKDSLVSGCARQLRVKGSLKIVNAGSRAARYWLGMGAGEGRLTYDVSFVDEKNAVLARGLAQGTVRSGWGGGDLESANQRAASAITAFYRENKDAVVAVATLQSPDGE